MTTPLELFIRESWAIEGQEFLQLDKDDQHMIVEAHKGFRTTPLSVASLIAFVKVCEPKARLRTNKGDDVSVAGHRAPAGGEQIPVMLEALLKQIVNETRPVHAVAFDYYWRYLWLHPFTDCNGRSARALWYLIAGIPPEGQGFLETYHYRSLTWQDAYRSLDDRPAAPTLAADED